jgi:hypothetical protein
MSFESIWLRHIRSDKVVAFPRDFSLYRRKILSQSHYLTLAKQANKNKLELFISVYSDYEVQNCLVTTLFYDIDLEEDVLEFISKYESILNKVRAYYSGRRGVHIYVDLEPIRIGDLRRASEHMAELLGIIDYVDKHVLGDWRRMSRVPYSYHTKSGNMCDVINPSTDSSLSRELTQLLEKFKLKSQRYVVNIPQETREVVSQLGEPPPCISFLLSQLISGVDLSHAARIHIGAYLMNLGLKPEEAGILFANVSDYNEQITLYQLRWLREHSYKMFRCEKAKQYGLCPLGMFEVCQYYPTPNRFFDKL